MPSLARARANGSFGSKADISSRPRALVSGDAESDSATSITGQVRAWTRWRCEASRSRADPTALVAPVASADHAVIARGGCGQILQITGGNDRACCQKWSAICRQSVIVWRETVLYPLQDIAAHIVKPETVRRKCASGRGVDPFVAPRRQAATAGFFPVVGMLVGLPGPPEVGRRSACSCGIFPLCFGEQTVVFVSHAT